MIALGDAAFFSSMTGTIPGLASRFPKLLKKAEYQGLLVTVPVTEYKTSKVSNQQLYNICIHILIFMLNRSAPTAPAKRLLM